MHNWGGLPWPWGEVFFVSECQKVSREPFKVSEKMECRKILRTIGGYHELPPKVFSLMVPKNFVVEPFDFSENSRMENFYEQGRSITFFYRQFSVSQCRKDSLVTLQCLKKFGLSKSFMHKGRVSRFFIERFESHSANKNRRGALRFSRKFLLW